MRLNRLYLAWGAGSLGVTALISVQGYLLLFFLVQMVGIQPGIAGNILFAGKLVDFVAYPLLGILSDRTDTRWGRRRPYLFGGGMLGATAMVMLFNPPIDATEGAIIAWATVGSVLLAIAIAAYLVPYMAMPAEMTDTPQERTVIMGYRSLFLMLGTFTGSAAAAFLAQQFGGDRAAYGMVAWLLVPLVLGTMLWSFFGTASAASRIADPALRMRLGDIPSLARNRPYMLVVGIKCVQFLGFATANTVMLFLITILLDKPQDYLAYYGATIILVSAALMPFWVALSNRIGKKAGFTLALVLYAATQMSWLLAGPAEPLSVFLLRSAAVGLCSGGLLVTGQSMLIDTMAYDRVQSGQSREGLLSSLYSFGEKISNAGGPLLMGWILQAASFVPGEQSRAGQPDSALFAIEFGVAWMILITTAFNLILLYFYRLTEDQVAALAEAVPAGEAKASPLG